MRLAIKRCGIGLAFVAVLGACSNPQGAGAGLVHDLPLAYPSQITAISFENSPPLDPPTLFIDLAPSMTPAQQLRFLCDDLVPRIEATKAVIAATVSYGWTDDDCR